MNPKSHIRTIGIAILLSFTAISLTAETAGGLSIKSPDKNLEAVISTDGSGHLTYELLRNGTAIIERSNLGISLNGTDLGDGVELSERVSIKTIDETMSMRGSHSTTRNFYNTSVIELIHKSANKPWRLEVRMFNNGMAFRYALEESAPETIDGEPTSFNLPAGSEVHYQKNTKNYEGLYQKERPENIDGTIGMPVIVELAGGGYVVIAEAALYGYSGMTLKTQQRTLQAVFEDDESWQAVPNKDSLIKTPWRVVMVANNLNDLVNNDIINNLNPPPSPELFGDADEWIKPGRALWSWWARSTSATRVRMQRKYADAASELGFEYILVDEGWEFWMGLGKTKWDVLADLVDYGDTKGVKVWVWKHWKKLNNEIYRNNFFAKVKKTGVVGVKIDFMDSESKHVIDFYEAALIDAARHKLMVNFHGANKPTGESRTYPNEMTREGIRGLEFNKGLSRLTPDYNAILPFTRLLVGHADYTPTTFNPIRLGDTSYAHQLAMPIVYFSPVTHYAEQPELILDNPEVAPAMDVLKSIPTVWDETIVLKGSKLGKCAAFARRSGDRWFVGILNGNDPLTLKIALSFLGKGKHKAIVLADRMDDQAAFKRSEMTVRAGSILEAEMRGGGGFVVMLVPAD